MHSCEHAHSMHSTHSTHNSRRNPAAPASHEQPVKKRGSPSSWNSFTNPSTIACTGLASVCQLQGGSQG